MRQIKFRGYNAKNKQWLYGFYLQNRGAHFVCPDEFANGKSWEDYEVDPESVGQYTGLKDANGKEIYEGDVIKLVDGTWKGVVTWHTDGYFYIDTSFGEDKLTTNHRPLGEMLKVVIDGERMYFEVTGNIYNKENEK